MYYARLDILVGIPILAIFLTFAIAPNSSLAASAKSKLSTYTNQTYAFSFRYPSDCTLREGDEAKLNWGYLGAVDAHMPQAVTIAAVELPGNWYRGTDLGMAFMNVSVDSSLPATLCGEGSPKVRVGAIDFTEHEDGDGGMGHSRYAKYYHVFRNRTCYEFELGESTNGYGSVEGITKVDDDAVFRKLKAILATVTIRPVTIAPLGRPF
jgi:hypothetical protein